MIGSFDLDLHTRVVFGAGTLDRLGELARELDSSALLSSQTRDCFQRGLRTAQDALLASASIESWSFHEFEPNPDMVMVEAGRVVAAAHQIDSLVALGGGSSLDCAKGINFVLTNGGTMRDYWGFGKARLPMLPSIGIPTTAGTGSEAQAYALISDTETHRKMACGDPKASFRVAVLDPELTAQPTACGCCSGRIRCHFPCGGVLRYKETHGSLGSLRTGSMAATRGEL
jgi:alcohol dehydrogenase